MLALEYAYIADTTGGALISLLPVMKKPHFRLQVEEEEVIAETDAFFSGFLKINSCFTVVVLSIGGQSE